MSISPGPDAFQNNGANGNSAEGDFPWEMIGLGLDEPLPPQDVVEDLCVQPMIRSKVTVLTSPDIRFTLQRSIRRSPSYTDPVSWQP